jgi:hypothetical protein
MNAIGFHAWNTRRLRRCVLLVLHTACASGDEPKPAPERAVWTDATAWRLSSEPVLTIDASKPRERAEGSPLDPAVAFRLRDGRYVVADGNVAGWHALLIFDSAGAFLQQLGRQGSGPAEFKQLHGWAGEWGPDSIAGYDASLDRFQIWSRDGTFGRTLQLPQGIPHVLSNGRHVRKHVTVSEQARRQRRGNAVVAYNLHAPDGALLLELSRLTLRVEDEGGPDAPNYALRLVLAAGRDHWYVAEWKTFSVAVYDTLGTHVRTLTRALPTEPFSRHEKDEIIRNRLRLAGMGEGIIGSNPSALERSLRKNTRWPEHLPALQAIVEDTDGNVWIQHYYSLLAPHVHPADGRVAKWSVFDPSGRFLGELSTPPRFTVSSITRDQLIGFRTDESDVRHVHAYRIIKP